MRIGIALTNACNLQCKYCFAQNITKQHHLFLRPNEYKELLEFSVTGSDDIGLAGGEPMINPWFGEILNMTVNDSRVHHVIVYSNGINGEKYANDLMNPKVSMLINVNSEKDIGTESYERIDKFLVRMKENCDMMGIHLSDKLGLGINIYENDFDPTFIINLMHKYDLRFLRTSITTRVNEPELEVLDYFRDRLDSYFNVIKTCIEAGLVPTADCNQVPMCLWTEEHKQFFISHGMENFTNHSACFSPVITLLPDKTAINCFSLEEISKVDISNFDNLMELVGYYEATINGFIPSAYTNEECKHCMARKKKLCSMGCPSMHMKSLKKFIRMEEELKYDE